MEAPRAGVKVLYRERALADIEDIFLFLNERSPTGARSVLRAVHEAIGEIAEHPRQDSWAVSLQDFLRRRG